MPNYDAGHYFLTVLAPIRLDSIIVDGQSHSRRHLIREKLADMPTAESTVVSIGKCTDNPFARNTRTHLARFVVLDDVVFNGRVSGDTLVGLALNSVRGLVHRPPTNPLTPQKVDRLSTPFLIFVADFDAESGADDELRGYLAGLWKTMEGELRGIFEHCFGFENVNDPESFFDYIKKCQIETTMPFNDYWSVPLNAPDYNLKPSILAAIGVVVATGLVAWAIHLSWYLIVGLPVLGIAVILFPLYRRIMAAAQIPFPKSPAPAPASDLPTVLKALYLQRGFTDLAIRAQGMDDQKLYQQFGDFIVQHKPAEIAGPTQKPGVIGI